MSNRLFTKNSLLRCIGLTGAGFLFLKTKSFKELFAKEVDNEKLISVQLITRHGARTPLNKIPGIEEAPYTPDVLEPFVKAKVSLKNLDGTLLKNEISWFDRKVVDRKLRGGASPGRLTNIGEQQMFRVGKRLKDKYITQYGFLPEIYDPNLVYTRSSHFFRTIDSAKSLLGGMFSDSPNDTSINFIIHAHNNENDLIFPNSLRCPLFRYIEHNAHKLPLLDTPEYVLELEELNNHLDVNDREKFLSYTGFRDDLICRITHDRPVPKDLIKFLDKADGLASKELFSVLEHNVKISIGLFLNMILGNIQKAINTEKSGDANNKLIYYSGHDTTVAAVLVALNHENENKMDYHWPPFCADITIELWKNEINENDYFFRVFYLGKPLILSQCNSEFHDKTKCDYRKFIDLLKKSSVDENEYNKICNQSLESYNLNLKK